MQSALERDAANCKSSNHQQHPFIPCLYTQGKPALWNSVLEAEDHADDVEHFQDYLDPLDTEGTAEDNDDQQPAQHSMRNTSAQRAQQGASSSKEKEVQKADSSSEEEAAEPSQQQDDTSDSEEEETLRAGNQDLEPSPNGIRNQLPGPEGESHAGDVGPGVKLMGGYDMRKRYAVLFTCMQFSPLLSRLQAISAQWSRPKLRRLPSQCCLKSHEIYVASLSPAKLTDHTSGICHTLLTLPSVTAE